MNEITLREGFRVFIEREVLWRDLDALNHMNNVTSLYYFEDARIAYWKRLVAMGLGEWNSILAHIECDYVSQAVMGETLVVAIKAVLIGHRSFTQEYLISEQASSRIVTRGRSVSACFQYSEGQSCPISPAIASLLGKLEGHPIERKEKK